MADNKKYFLDLGGLQTLWSKMTGAFASKDDVNGISGNLTEINKSITALQGEIDGVENLTLLYAPKTAETYSKAVEMAASLSAGTIIVVGSEETVDGKKYLKGFYIVDNDKSVQYVGTTDGSEDTDVIASLRQAIESLQKQIITASTIVDSNNNILGGFTIANNTLITVYDDAVVADSDSVNALTHRAIARKFGELESMISTLPKFEISIVDALPESNISLSTIYLVKNSDNSSNNIYVEYIYLQNKGWEKLGEQSISLDNYVTKDFLTTEINNALKNYVTSVDVDNSISIAKQEILETVSQTYATKNDIAGIITEADILASIQSGAIGNAIAISDEQIEALQ